MADSARVFVDNIHTTMLFPTLSMSGWTFLPRNDNMHKEIYQYLAAIASSDGAGQAWFPLSLARLKNCLLKKYYHNEDIANYQEDVSFVYSPFMLGVIHMWNTYHHM